MTLIDLFKTLFNRNNTHTEIVVKSNTTKEIDFEYPDKTDKAFVRGLYHNTNKNYSLAAHLTKTIINNNVNFIGEPTLYAQKKIIDIIESVDINYRKVHRAIELDGDVFIWPQWDDTKKKIVLVSIPIDVIDTIFVNPMTKEVVGYRFKENITYSTINEKNNRVSITYIITAKTIQKIFTGTINKVITVENKLGIMPIIHFSNEKEDNELYGHSELQNIIPQLKFYHDLTYEAGAAQTRDGHPKMKVTTKSIRQWLDNNFGTGTHDAVIAGKKVVTMEDRDLFLNAEGDDVSYLYLNKTSGDYATMAETAFTNIVEGSEVPEINFGANIGTSLASVKEYRPIWIKKIESKQKDKTNAWIEVYNVIIAIHNFVNFSNIKNDIKIVWPRPNFASIKEQAEILDAFAKAIEKLSNKRLVSREEIYDTLKALDIVKLTKTYKEHQKIIDSEIINVDKKTQRTDDKAGKATDKDTAGENEDNT